MGYGDRAKTPIRAPPLRLVAQMEDKTMRSAFDFSPYRRSTVGFDRLFDMLENSNLGQGQENYPPFDLIKRAKTITVSSSPSPASSRMRSTLPPSRTCCWCPAASRTKRTRRVASTSIAALPTAPSSGGSRWRITSRSRRGPEGRPALGRAGPRNPRGDEAAEDRHRRERG